MEASPALDVSIVIINYKTIELTTACIHSVIEHTKGVHYEIILIENGTNEFNHENTKQWSDKLQLIISPENIGFSKANNLGIAQAKAKYILLLNSDTYLQQDAITATYQFLEKNKQVGVVSPRLVYPDGRHQSVAQRFPSVRYGLFELLRIQKLIPKRLAGKILLGSFFNHQETVAVDWVWGAFFMFPKSILNQLPMGKLDDSYFMYWEDVQWCWDIARLGYKIYFFADAELVHIHQGSKGQKNELMKRNGVVFLTKNYRPITIKLINIITHWLKR